MIHEFAVENVLSFKNQQVISFEASSDKTYEDFYVVKKGAFRLLKLALLYGANASGKTNILIALDYLRNLATEPAEDRNESIDIPPFLLDMESRKSDSKFYISFFIGQTRYVYNVTLNSRYISHEKLIYYPKTQPALLFERVLNKENNLSKITFGDKAELTKNEKIILEGNTILNQTVLSSYLVTNVESEQLEIVTDWFTGGLLGLISPGTDLTQYTGNMIASDEKIRKFTVEALKFADFNIDDVLVKKDKEPISSEFIEFMNSKTQSEEEKEKFAEFLKLNNSIEVRSLVFQYLNESQIYELPFAVQSEGTQRYFGLTGPLQELVHDNVSIPIDEIESSLHYELVNAYLKTFLVNSSDSQIICSTHNINLLEEDFIRRDSIWFCEKDKYGASEVFPLKSFRMHKNVNVLNAYKIGKLGAKPEVSGIFLEDE